MKVLLAYRCADEAADDPEAAALPSGLPWLAAALRRDGHEAWVVNFSRLGWKDVERYLADARPDLAGISCFTANRVASVRLARLVRRAHGGCRITLGGPHATHVAETLLRRVREVDFVVRGEGEAPLAGACSVLAAGEGIPALARVGGVVVRGVSAAPLRLPGVATLAPPWQGWTGAAGVLPDRDLRHVVASRPRPGGPERRPPSSIVDEVRALRDDMGVVEPSLVGPGLAADPSWLAEIAASLEAERVAAAWDVAVAPHELVDAARRDEAATLRALREAHGAGCRRARVTIDVERPGPEADPDVLTEAGRLVRAAGIAPDLTLRVGAADRDVDVEGARTLLRAFRPRHGRIEIRELLPGTEEFAEAAAAEGLDDGYWFDEDRATVPLPVPRQAEVAVASLAPALRDVTRGAMPTERDLSALESASGATAWVQVEWGDYRAALGDLEEAERRLRLASQARPWSPFPWMRLAALFARRRGGDAARESAALEQVLQRVPRHEPSRERLAALREGAGRGGRRPRKGRRRR